MTAISATATAVVIGGGTMGAGIAQTLLSALPQGTVTIVECDSSAAQLAVERVEHGLRRRHDRILEPDRVAADLSRLRTAIDIATSGTASFVVEAVPEDLALKKAVLAAAATTWPEALIASNTSSLSVNELRRAIGDVRFIGMHFFNPVPRSKLVEIVVPDGCRAEVVDEARAWASFLGKESIEVRDAPGFATSRLGVAIGLEAIRMVEDGVATAADIDRGMVLGYQFPIGPLELTDRIGLDVRLAIAEHLAATLGPRFAPPQLLRYKVAAGELGQKSGRGFYDWDTAGWQSSPGSAANQCSSGSLGPIDRTP